MQTTVINQPISNQTQIMNLFLLIMKNDDQESEVSAEVIMKKNEIKSLFDAIKLHHSNIIALSQSQDKGQPNLLDSLLDKLFLYTSDIDEILLEVIIQLISWGSISNYTIPALFKPLAKDYHHCKVNIARIKYIMVILDALFTENQRQIEWPYQMLYLQTPDCQIRVQHSASVWPFTKGMVLVMWIYILPDQQDCNLFKLTVGNTFSSAIKLQGQNIIYNSVYQQNSSRQVFLGTVPLNQWVYLRWDLKPLNGQKFGIQMHTNQIASEQHKVDFPNLQGVYQLQISFVAQFVGYLSSIFLFKDQISFNPMELRFGLQSESQLKHLYKMMEQDFHKIYIMFTPLRMDDMCYDVVGLNHGEIVGNIGLYVNNLALRKWKNLISLQQLFPLFHFLKYIDRAEYPEYLNDLLQLLIKLFTNKTESQTEANQLEFFPLLSHFIIKGHHSFFTQNSIHFLAELYQTLLDKNLKDKMLTDMIWVLNELDFDTPELFEEYFQLIRVIYNQNPIQCIQKFSISDILNQLIEHCIVESPTQIQTLKIRLYFGLIRSISLLVLNNAQYIKQRQIFLKSMVLQLLRFISDRYLLKITLGILDILQNLLNIQENEETRLILQQPENLTSLLILSVQTNSHEFKTSLINLIHKVVYTNQSQELEACINLSQIFNFQDGVVSHMNSRQSFVNKNISHSSYKPLYVALMNWTLHTTGRLDISESVLIDDSMVIKSKPALQIVLMQFQLTDYQLKGQILQDLYTLVKLNSYNSNMLVENETFHRIFIKVILELQIKLFESTLTEYEDWIWSSGMKIYLQIIWHSMLNQINGFRRISQMIMQIQVLEEEQTSEFTGLACKFLLRSLMLSLLTITKDNSLNIFIQNNPNAHDNIKILLILILEMFICDPLQSDKLENQALVLHKHFRLSFKLFIVDPVNIPLNWSSAKNNHWIDFNLLIIVLQLCEGLIQKYTLNIEITNDQMFEQLFESSYNEEMKDLLIMLFQNYKVVQSKSSNVNYLRVMNYVFNLYSDYILVNDLSCDYITELDSILKYQNNLTSSVILLFEIIKSKQILQKNQLFELEEKVYFYALEHLNFLYGLQSEVEGFIGNEVFEQYTFQTHDESQQKIMYTRNIQTKVMNKSISNFISFLQNLNAYVKQYAPQSDKSKEKKKYLTSRILIKLMKQNIIDKTQNEQPQILKEDINNVAQFTINKQIQIFFTQSPYILKKLNQSKLKYQDLETFKQNENIQQKKDILRKYQDVKTTYEEVHHKFSLHTTAIINQIDKNYEQNQLFRQQDRLIYQCSAKNQQRKSWNQLFSQIGVWQFNENENQSFIPPQNFTFKISNHMTKSKLRPFLKLKRTFSEFDDLPIFKELPSRSRINDVPQNSVENQTESPLSRRKDQLQWNHDNQVQLDWMDNFVLLIKELGQQSNKNGITFYQVQWIKTLTARRGSLEISNNQIRFICQPTQEALLFLRHKFPQSRQLIRSWSLSDVQFACVKRYMQRKNCICFIMKDGQSLLFNMQESPDNILQKVIQILMQNDSKRALKIQALYQSSSMDSYFEKQKKTLKWQKGQMSNLSYLLYLNHLAGRNYKDLTQYPVLPWVLKKYHGQKIDLNNSENYRDLSKPMGACGSPERTLAFHQKFYNSDLHLEGVPQFHYGSHYSNPGIVMHFLIRLQPFSRGARELQSGRWDIPDRLFYSIKELYFNSINEMSDVRELVPEVYILPEMFINVQKHNFGYMQTGEHVNHVIMPQYASDPYKFVALHREAFESECVSKTIHNWIDLIFGYKQRGKAAEENLNQFYYLTYQDTIQLDSIKDPAMKQSLESQVMHFGQTPIQLLTKPHPQKMLNKRILVSISYLFNVKIFDEEASLVKIPFRYTKVEVNPFLSLLNIFQKEPTKQEEKKQKKILFMAQLNESKIIQIQKDGKISIVRLHDQQGINDFSEERIFDINLMKNQDELTIKFNPDQLYSQIRIDYLKRCQYLLVGGGWDGKLEVYFLQMENNNNKKIEGQQRTSYSSHYGQITAISHDDKENFVVTGCSAGILNIWRVDKQSLRLQATFNDHRQSIQDIDISSELKMIATCSSDGRINLYNLFNHKYLRSYLQNVEIQKVKLISCPIYGIVYCTEQQLCFLSMNGQLISKIELSCQTISSLSLTQKVNFDQIMYYVNQQSDVIFLSLPFLGEICKINITSERSNKAFVLTLQDNSMLLAATREGVIQLFAEGSRLKTN